MPVGADWLLAQGEDAHLLFSTGAAFDPRPPQRIGVAVSGGSDSMALLHLLARIGPEAGWSVEAVTVDHGLRPEAKAEAGFVGIACAKIGVPHTVLEWRRTATTGNLHDQAARGRYALMTRWAQERDIGTMAVGHTADDQAETFLMRLGREAGIDGLSGMRHDWLQKGVRWVRPLLFQRRADLRDYLNRHGIGWVDDPSNDDTRFQRVKARKLLAELKPLGITAKVLSGVAFQLSSARNALDAYGRDIASRIAVQTCGDMIFDRRGLITSEPEVRRRLLIATLRWVSGKDYPPRSSAQVELDIAIHEGRDKTLAGCRIICSQTEVRIFREPNAVRSLATPTGPNPCWKFSWWIRSRFCWS